MGGVFLYLIKGKNDVTDNDVVLKSFPSNRSVSHLIKSFYVKEKWPPVMKGESYSRSPLKIKRLIYQR
jgi:hypothetical protein